MARLLALNAALEGALAGARDLAVEADAVNALLERCFVALVQTDSPTPPA